jgi:hypothetical protein
MLEYEGASTKRQIENDTSCKILLMPEQTQALVWAASRSACMAGVERLQAILKPSQRDNSKEVPWRRGMDTQTPEGQATSSKNAIP